MTRDACHHYRRYYHPANATLVVVGDVDTEDVLERAERHFQRHSAGLVNERKRPAAATTGRAACPAGT